MAEALLDFMSELEAQCQPGAFKPHAYYGPEEDSLTFYFRDEESYAERYNRLVTLFRSFATNEVVGCQVKGIQSVFNGGGHFGAAIKVGRVELGLFFHLLAYDEAKQELFDLGQRAKGMQIDVPPSLGKC